jgi:hypothetical protein
MAPRNGSLAGAFILTVIQVLEKIKRRTVIAKNKHPAATPIGRERP